MASTKPYSLEELTEALTTISRRRLISQSTIANALSIDQGTISKAKLGKLKRKTSKTDALMSYVKRALRAPPISPEVLYEVNNFYANNGSQQELLYAIRLAKSMLATSGKEEMN